MYQKKDMIELKENSAVPIEVFDDINIEEKKLQLFDLLGSYQAKSFLVFTALPNNEKLQQDVYRREDIFSNVNIIYALVPVSIKVYKDLIGNELAD